jgi:hypothetical protein
MEADMYRRASTLSDDRVSGGGGGGGGLSCFAPGTQVTLVDGTTSAIEQITVGDEVLGFDGVKTVPVRVEALECPVRDHLCVLSFDDGTTLKLTNEHPLYTSTGWKSLSPEATLAENEELLVSRLAIGDRVLVASGDYRRLGAVFVSHRKVQTYNISLLFPHNTFFVNGFLTHSKARSDLKSVALNRPWPLELSLPDAACAL